MKRATVVIGSSWGDEGKGLLTDYLCAKLRPAAVVRFNGGAQAGHTVQLQNGTRHVFSHFGAGTLAGVPTILPKTFISNPVLWRKEFDILRKLRDLYPLCMGIDIGSPLTTPYDMLVNQIIESRRGSGRHGSVGVGINETITRNEKDDYETVVFHILHQDAFVDRLLRIRDVYFHARLSELGFELSSAERAIFQAPGLLDAYLEDCKSFRHHNKFLFEYDLSKMLKSEFGVVFEGAQGLLLDEKHEFFPHVTRSRTGLTNVIPLAQEAGITDLDVVYVTRAYMTRHGAGPFPSEDESMSFADPTNVRHEFQGALRFGALDLDLLSKTIWDDVDTAKMQSHNKIKIHPRLAITCLDQFENKKYVLIRHGVEQYPATETSFINAIRHAVGMEEGYISRGPMRRDVSEIYGQV